MITKQWCIRVKQWFTILLILFWVFHKHMGFAFQPLSQPWRGDLEENHRNVQPHASKPAKTLLKHLIRFHAVRSSAERCQQYVYLSDLWTLEQLAVQSNHKRSWIPRLLRSYSVPDADFMTFVLEGCSRLLFCSIFKKSFSDWSFSIFII